MKEQILEVIIVGAGHAGLSASYYLARHGLEHIVFERGKAGHSWRSQRWDSFKLNTPNKLVTLPGEKCSEADAENFCSANEFACSYDKYISTYRLPVEEHTSVISIVKDNGLFIVTVSKENTFRQYQCRQVIIASGSANEKIIPSFAANISRDVKLIHAAEYRNASALPAGSVLVVGGAQSGIQIAEDLIDAGRKVYFATSMVARVPRQYRGRDIHDWLLDMKFFDATKEQMTDPVMLKMKPPHLTGVGDKPKTISLQSLAKKGVVVIGKMEGANGKNLFFQPNAATHVKFADGFSAKAKEMIDEFINKNEIPAPAREKDEDDLPDINAECASAITSINTEEYGIKSIVWTTGFGGNFNYIRLPVLDNDGNPKQHSGLSDTEGLYFVGLPWMRNRKSVTLPGIKEDAEFIAEKVFTYARDKKRVVTAEA